MPKEKADLRARIFSKRFIRATIGPEINIRRLHCSQAVPLKHVGRIFKNNKKGVEGCQKNGERESSARFISDEHKTLKLYGKVRTMQ